MKLVPIGALVLLLASLVSLISNRQSGQLFTEGWTCASRVLSDTKLAELQRITPERTGRIFELLPEPFRQKFTTRTWEAVELMTFRSLLLWHLVPAFPIPFFIGFLEGTWARSNQNALVKMHSPMRFSLALTALGLTPVLALLWITAPIDLSATLLVFTASTIEIVSTRNLIVHAPTQF